MAWPVVDILPPPGPVGVEWVYASAPAYGATAQATAVWSQNVVRYQGEPIVPNLYSLRIGGSYRGDHWFLHTDVHASSWDGLVGFANPRLVVGYANKHVVAQASAIAPVTSFDAFIGAPAWAYEASVSAGGSWYMVTAGTVQRTLPEQFWQPSAYAALGIRYGGLTVEARGERDAKHNALVEAGASYGWKIQCYQLRPAVAGGLSHSIGTPSIRIRLAVQYGCEKASVPLKMEIVESHLWIEADRSVSGHPSEAVKYPTPHDSIGGFLTANPDVRVYIRTNLSETQAQRALSVFVAKGLNMSQVERTDYVFHVAGEPFYLDFVVIRGNKNSEATDAPLEMVP